MIKRYDAYNTDPSIIGPFYDPDENGRWVEYTDAQKLEQELAEVKAANQHFYDRLKIGEGDCDTDTSAVLAEVFNFMEEFGVYPFKNSEVKKWL